MNAVGVLLLVVGLAIIGWLVWTYLQHNARLLQTRTTEFAGGVRFEAHTFAVEMHQNDKHVKVSAQPGSLKVMALKLGTGQAAGGMSEVYLPAAGLTVALERTPISLDMGTTAQATTTFDIVFSTTEGLGAESDANPHAPAQAVRVQGLPEPVARSFQSFASRLTIWADKVTKFAEQDKALAQQAAQEAAAALEAQAKEEAAKAAAAEQAGDSLDLTSQIAKWRKTAGFSGQHSEVGLHDKGGINWFVDLDPSGRITLHGNKRTVFTTLHGASIRALPKGIEIGVRDEFWSDGEPLIMFQVLQGSPPNERRNWMELLEAARNRIDISMRKGY